MSTSKKLDEIMELAMLLQNIKNLVLLTKDEHFYIHGFEVG